MLINVPSSSTSLRLTYVFVKSSFKLVFISLAFLTFFFGSTFFFLVILLSFSDLRIILLAFLNSSLVIAPSL